jgi:hypothetical protein
MVEKGRSVDREDVGDEEDESLYYLRSMPEGLYLELVTDMEDD